MALYLWLAAITGVRRGELCALQVCDVDLENGVLHLAHNYVVVVGQRVRKDTKTHQDRYLAIDPVTCALLCEHLEAIRTELGRQGLELPKDAYVFSNDPMGASPWNLTGPRTRPATWRSRPGSSSISRDCGTTQPANCLQPGSTCATLRPVLATAAAGPPRYGTMSTRYRRLTGEPPLTSHS